GQLSQANVSIIGQSRPTYNSTNAPTALIDGSIIQGNFSVIVGANNLVMKNVGFDAGPNFINAFYTGVPTDSLSIYVPGQAYAIPPVNGLVVDNVNCLNYSATAATHCMIFENVYGAHIHNTQSFYGGHGGILKGYNDIWDGHFGRGHLYDTIIIKSDEY